MKKYNDNNIKKLVKLLTKRNRPIENLIWRGSKIGIEKEEVINPSFKCNKCSLVDAFKILPNSVFFIMSIC